MTKPQFWALNIICFVLAILLLAQFALDGSNQKLVTEVNNRQAVVKNAQQLEPVLDQLAKRIAHDSDTNAALRNLLVKYDMHVTLEVDGKQKKYP
jgi:hypothetical protein